MGLKPLEFSECLLDSPYFRETVYEHEKELDDTNESIKSLIKECRNYLKALENLSKSQHVFQDTLKKFKLRYIGEIDTDDEIEIEDAFSTFSVIFGKVGEELDRMFHHSNGQLIKPLEKFRLEQIGQTKEEKKNFDRETTRICGLIEKHLAINPKKNLNILQEADAQMGLELRNFNQQSLSYVSRLQEVNEKKKFEFVEIMLSFVRGQQLFYHTGHDVFIDHKEYLDELQYKLQTSRERFYIAQEEAESLKGRVLKRYHNGDLFKDKFAREGYLLVCEKKRGVLGATWQKHYCTYQKENKILTMLPYGQTAGKLIANTDTFVVSSCVRRATDTCDRRFCFDVTSGDRSLTIQALSEEDQKQWLEVMEGKEPIYLESSELVSQNEGVTTLSSTGIEFVRKCIEAIEARGLDDQGIYRIAGVSSKFSKLLQLGMDPKQLEKLDFLSDEVSWEVKTITSAMKQFFRSLSQPLLTFKLHADFISAIKLDTYEKRIHALRDCLRQLPDDNLQVLNMLFNHLQKVADHSSRNLMQASNLGVIFGPTLMRPKEETMAAIMSIKYQSVVVETMIKEYDKLFSTFSNLPVSSNTSAGSKPSTSEALRTAASDSNPGSKKIPAPLPPRVKPLNRPPSKSGLTDGSSSVTDPPTITPGSEVITTSPGSSELPAAAPSPALKPRTNANNVFVKRDLQLREKPALPPPKQKYVEAVPTFTSPLSSACSSEEDFSGPSPRGPTRAFSYEIAVRGKECLLSAAFTKMEMLPEDSGSETEAKLSNALRSDVAPPVVPRRKEWRVRTMYNCVADNESELSFHAGAIITNVRSSTEEGWLIGTLNGKTGLIPTNYCETID